MNCELLNKSEPNVERLYTIKGAAEALGLHYWKLLRAVNRGDIKSYSLLNSRKLVRLSEIVAAMEGGSDD